MTHATQTLVNKEANVKIYMDMPSADVILGITGLIVKVLGKLTLESFREI